MYRVFNLFKVLKLYCEVEVFEDCNWVIGNFLLLLNCFALRWLAGPYLDFSGTLFSNDFHQVPWAKSSTMGHLGGVWQPFWLIYKQI